MIATAAACCGSPRALAAATMTRALPACSPLKLTAAPTGTPPAAAVEVAVTVHMAIEVWTPWCRSHVTSTPCCFSGVALALALRADHPRDLGGESRWCFRRRCCFRI